MLTNLAFVVRLHQTEKGRKQEKKKPIKIATFATKSDFTFF